ncbi:2-C-methyl-D-erythritol 2,4-cyclodiphosphate synthase [Thiohalobacter thiocyanaticus]|uniref:2-C-methyl-D-erythritol 2,4-cyclodiphosphate synthase n=1 Tax=Thiohalobacter thiocyanaticus TaxID=585455 RepID=A0A426QE59_9GAMM|nr:2-C-methyl-D-erythritol 2,4-cyclodiphosphate synthase [Thiohalobacter thiocyanaticus]RRQ20036.1 2-C-methyl-D-erythritol 2,4-cyclodiphosphate synthase [Thiohalobacter thiocyanaticus]
MRIGQGFDAHAFRDGGRLVLGGVEIPHDRGLEAHSDGDVALHALCDALLGAAALGDIGKHFPDSDPQYKGVDSRRLLRGVMEKITDKGYRVINADLTLIAQAPKLAPHIDAMRDNIAADLNVDPDCINVKATTTEKMGFTGRGEGIAALAAVLLKSSA